MSKTIIAATAAVAMLSFGSLVPAQAGGSATSAASKYNAAIYAASVDRDRQQARAAGYTITEFSSSSARASGPRR